MIDTNIHLEKAVLSLELVSKSKIRGLGKIIYVSLQVQRPIILIQRSKMPASWKPGSLLKGQKFLKPGLLSL